MCRVSTLQQLAGRGGCHSTTNELDNVQWNSADGHDDRDLPGETGGHNERQICARAQYETVGDESVKLTEVLGQERHTNRVDEERYNL